MSEKIEIIKRPQGVQDTTRTLLTTVAAFSLSKIGGVYYV